MGSVPGNNRERKWRLGVPANAVAFLSLLASSLVLLSCGRKITQPQEIIMPPAPVLLSTIDTPGNARAVRQQGNYAYIADFLGGLQIVAVAEPTAPIIVGRLQSVVPAIDLLISGNYAFVACGSAGVQVVNVTVPTVPVSATQITATSAKRLAIAGNTLFVADSVDGLLLVDISDPSSPQILATHSPAAPINAIAAAGDIVWLVDADAQMIGLDVSDPQAIHQKSSLSLPSIGREVVLSGSNAYIGSAADGVLTVNIANPSAPVLLSSWDTPGTPLGLFVQDDFLFIADSSGGLQIANIATPTNFLSAGDLNLAGAALDVFANGNVLYLAADDRGLSLIRFPGNISETTFVQLNPPWDRERGYEFNNPGAIIIGYDTYLYVADTDNNRIIRLDAAGTISAYYSVPHPVAIAQDELLRLLVVTGQSREIYKIDVGPGGDGVAVRCFSGRSTKDSLLGIDSTEVFTAVADAPDYRKKYYVASASPLIDQSGKVLAFGNAVAIGENSDTLYDPKFLVSGDTARNPIIAYGTGLGYADHPIGLVAFRRNNIEHLVIVQDSASFKVQLLNWSYNTYYRIGWYAATILPGPDNDLYRANAFTAPLAATIDSSGNLYVVQKSAGAIYCAFKFNSTGRLKEAFGQPGNGAGQLLNPRGVAYDSHPNRKTLFIVDSGNNRILRFKLSTDIQ